jgi:uncharacterized FlaG/YvyC family protein
MSTDTTIQTVSTVAAAGNQRGYSNSVDSVKAAGSMHMPASINQTTGKKLPQDETLQLQDAANEQRAVNEEDVSQAIQNLNDYAQNISRQLQFSIDDVTGRTVIKVLDTETKETIRQIPSEEILTLARTLHENNDDRGKLLEIRV